MLTRPSYRMGGPVLTGLVCAAAMCVAQPPSPADAPAISPPQASDGFEYWPADQRTPYRESEQRLITSVDPAKLREWHDLLAAEPHVAGTPGDERVITKIEAAFKAMGLEVERHDIWPLLAKPVSNAVEIVSPEQKTLQLRETPLTEDQYSQFPEHMTGWNAYSGSGDVTGNVVYANYGRKEDFEKLKSLGIDCTGKIVLARYGGNFRGYKAKFAQASGAAGLIIFTDPADSGYMKGLMYPEGGYANDTCIERGPLATLDYVGDPLTPRNEATQLAHRIPESEVALPKIPVQPVGYGAALEIMKRMTGTPVPEASWQGGLPLPYRITGGDDLKVRLSVKQDRAVTKTSNVIGTLRGSEEPEKLVILGCHHDAWGCGASDPTAGTITLMEAARILAKAASEGNRPKRTVVFCAWGAEEFGIIGSTEYVERERENLTKNAVAYINLDMASMGVDFGSSASPSLKKVIADVAKVVPQARDVSGKTVFDAWAAKGKDDRFPDLPKIGDLGGGSDHVAFLCHAGVPSCAMGAYGSKGTAYHSIYDTLAWYRKIVGEDYAPATMVTQMAAATAARLANAPLLPLEPWRYGADADGQLTLLKDRVQPVCDAATMAQAVSTIAGYRKSAPDVHTRLLVTLPSLSAEQLRSINSSLQLCDRGWLLTDGLPGRTWYRSLFVSPDRDSGYASWMLPLLRRALEDKDTAAVDGALREYVEAISRVSRPYITMERLLDSPDEPATGR